MPRYRHTRERCRDEFYHPAHRLDRGVHQPVISRIGDDLDPAHRTIGQHFHVQFDNSLFAAASGFGGVLRQRQAALIELVIVAAPAAEQRAARSPPGQPIVHAAGSSARVWNDETWASRYSPPPRR